MGERIGSTFCKERVHSLRKNSMLNLILGGAAVYRCDNGLIFNVGFSRCGNTAAQETLFPQPVQPPRQCVLQNAGHYLMEVN